MRDLDDITVRLAEDADAEWCVEAASLRGAEFVRQVPGVRELYLAEVVGQRVGLLILEVIWAGTKDFGLPFVSLIRVDETHRRRGIGKALLNYVSAQLRQQGHKLLMSSSTGNEAEPQAWHRHVGFEELGFLAGYPFDDRVGEVFFVKRLGH